MKVCVVAFMNRSNKHTLIDRSNKHILNLTLWGEKSLPPIPDGSGKFLASYLIRPLHSFFKFFFTLSLAEVGTGWTAGVIVAICTMCHTWDSSEHLAPANHLHLVAGWFKRCSILARVFVLHAWLSSVVFLTDSPVWTSSSLNLFCLFLPRLPDLAFGLFLILIVPGWYFFQRVMTLDINSCSGFSCELPHWIIRLVNHFDFIWTDRTGLLWECFVSFSLRSEICFFKWSLYLAFSECVLHLGPESKP